MNTLYRFYDHDNQLLYVGLTVNPGRRMERHRGKEWWADVATITMEQHPDLAALRAAEKIAIQTEKPLYNIRLTVGLYLDAASRAILAEGCSEWVDDKDDWCSARAVYVASRDINGGIFVCAEHATYYSHLEAVA